MSILSWLGEKIGLKSSGFWGRFFNGSTYSGETVTADKAMSLATVNRAIRLRAETVATLPLRFFESTPNGPKQVTGIEADDLLRVSPNGDQTPVEFWEGMIAAMDLLGDGLAEKHRNGGRVIALTQMGPDRVETFRNVQGTVVHRYTDPKGRQRDMSPDDVFQIKGFSFGGDRGLSMVRIGAQVMGLALAGEKTAGSLFRSGLRSSGFLKTAGVFGPEDRKKLQGILDEYVGSEKAGGLMILEGGMDYTPLSMSAHDAELLLSRKWNVEELARLTGTPPILLGHASEGQTMWGSGVEHIVQAWLTLGLAATLKRSESAIAKRLMSPTERQRIYAKFNVDALMRADSVARSQLYSTYAQNGIRTRDEIRALDELGPMPGGDVLTAQVNLVPLAQLGQTSDPAAQARDAIRAWIVPELLEDRRNDPPILPAP